MLLAGFERGTSRVRARAKHRRHHTFQLGHSTLKIIKVKSLYHAWPYHLRQQIFFSFMQKYIHGLRRAAAARGFQNKLMKVCTGQWKPEGGSGGVEGGSGATGHQK